MAMNQDDDPNAGGGGDWFAANAPPQSLDAQMAIIAAYKQYGGRDPSPEELQSNLSNPAGLAAVLEGIKNSPEAKAYAARGAAPAPTAAAGGGPSGGGSVQDFIRQWQQSHPASEGIGPLADALKAAGYNVSRYMYGSTPSNNELSLDGQKFKVLGGEDSPSSSYWYTGGDDSAGGKGGNQFAGYQGGDLEGFGAAPAPYQSAPWTGGDYTPPPLPEGLQTPYSAPTWQGGDFHDPTMAEVQATPGYQTRMDAGQRVIEHAAAAQGTVLNGGTQKALERYGQDYGTGEYQTARGNAFQDYQSRYGQFQDAANMGLNARQQNAGEYNTAVNQGQQTYQNRYGQYLGENQRTLTDYLTNTTTKRNADTDYWSRLATLYGGGLNAASGSYKPGIGTQ